MERVERETEIRVIHRIDEFPRMLVRVDVAAPREHCVREDHARLRHDLREHAELIGDERIVANGVRRYVAAHENAVRAEFVHQFELAFGALDVFRKTLGRYAIEIAERLEQIDFEAEIGAHAAHVGGRAFVIEQVVFEDFDAVETRRL